MLKTINNTVTVTFEYGSNGNVSTGQTQCNASVLINQGLLRIVKSSTPAVLGKEEHITYTIVVSMYETPRNNIIVEDILPDGLILDNNIAYIRNNADETMIEMTVENGTLIIENQKLTFIIGSMDADTIKTISFTASPSSNALNPIVNKAEVTYGDSDSKSSNYTSNQTRFTNLEIAKTAPDIITCNSNLSYTITITNTGTEDAAGVTLTDTLEFNSANFEILTPIAENIFVNGTMISQLPGILASISADKKSLTITGLSVNAKSDLPIIINGVASC